MTTALAPAGQRSFSEFLEPEGEERRLGQLIAGLWDRLATHARVECPICAGRMEPQYGMGARPISGRCAECGSELS
jgi:hypothetical protein